MNPLKQVGRAFLIGAVILAAGVAVQSQTVQLFKDGDKVTAQDLNEIVQNQIDINHRLMKVENQDEKIIERLTEACDKAETEVDSLGKSLGKTQTQVAFLNGCREAQSKQIAELERKMQGVQKQVTVLHAKKADKQ